MTAQITQTQQKRKKWEKMKGGREIRGNTSKIHPEWPKGQFFSFLLCLCDLCGHFEYNKPRFYGNFFSKKNSFKGGFKTHVLTF